MWMLRRTMCEKRPASCSASSTSRLHLEHLVALVVRDRLAREPDQPEPVEVVEVGGHLVEEAAAGLGADHRVALGDQARAGDEREPRAHVDRRLRALLGEQAQDPRLVGRQVGEDPLVGRVRALLVGDVGRRLQQLSPALAQRRWPRRLAGSSAVAEQPRRPASRDPAVASRRPVEQLARRRAGEVPDAPAGGPPPGAGAESGPAPRALERRVGRVVVRLRASSRHRSDPEDRQVERGRRRSRARRRGRRASTRPP